MTEMSDALLFLKPCPFCDKSVAEISNLQECESCANFEDEECPVCYAPEGFDVDADDNPCPRFIICPVYKGGCGASTGWYRNVEEMVEAWNRRADNQFDEPRILTLEELRHTTPGTVLWDDGREDPADEQSWFPMAPVEFAGMGELSGDETIKFSRGASTMQKSTANGSSFGQQSRRWNSGRRWCWDG